MLPLKLLCTPNRLPVFQIPNRYCEKSLLKTSEKRTTGRCYLHTQWLHFIIILRFAIGDTSVCSKSWIATDGKGFQQNIFARKKILDRCFEKNKSSEPEKKLLSQYRKSKIDQQLWLPHTIQKIKYNRWKQRISHVGDKYHYHEAT